MDTWKDRQGKSTIIKKKDAEYKQRELKENGEKTGKTLGKHVINQTLLEFLDGLKSKMLKNYDRTLRMTQSFKIKRRI